MKLADRIIARATSQIGYKEGPNNSNKYGRWYGMDNESWCAMFVSWVFSCEHALGAIATNSHGYAYCPSLLSWAKERHLLKSIRNITHLATSFSFAGTTQESPNTRESPYRATTPNLT